MRNYLAIFGIVSMTLSPLAVACSQSTEETQSADSQFGNLSLALLGQGSLGNQYQLTDATFTISGAFNLTVPGDPDTVVQSLPIGTYSIKLESGWSLQRVTSTGTTPVAATVASGNPQSFVINGAQTTALTWRFNVSPTSADQDDYEIVTVSNGTVNLSLATNDIGFANFSTGAQHTCGITVAGQLRCWGSNSSGELGYADSNPRTTVPSTSVNVGVGRTVKRVSASQGNHTCALLDDNTVKCWGYNGYGALGYADTSNRPSPPDPVVNLGSSNTAKSITTGIYHTCVILDTNSIKCWGNNTTGQLGYGDTTTRTSPAAAAIDLGVGNAAKEVVAGSSHTCALLANDTIKCWGDSSSGQTGYGSTTTRLAPPTTAINLGTGRTAKRIAAGTAHTCALLDNDSVKCWGNNNYGQLGYGDTATRTAPPDTAVNLGTGRTAKRIAAGASHTCAWLDDDSIKCWGSASSGQLGYEDTNQRSAPPALAVNLGTGRLPRRLLASADHTCVLLTDNGIKCWGANTNGAFGLGTASENRGDQLSEMGDNLPEVLP